MRLFITTTIVFACSLVCGISLLAQEDQSDEINKLKAENSRLLSLLERQQQDSKPVEASVKNRGGIVVPFFSSSKVEDYTFKVQDKSTYHDLADSYIKAMERKPSEFWIGVQCGPAPEMDLKFGEDDIPLTISEGVLVNSVVEESPAESAGIIEGDVILQFNGKKLLELQMLVEAIAETGETEARVHLVRDGELTVVNVTPTRRKQEEQKPAESVFDLPYYFMSDAIPEGYEVDIRLRKGESPTLAFLKEGKEEVSVNLETFSQLPRELLMFGGKAMEAVKNLDQESKHSYSIDLSRMPRVENYSPIEDDKPHYSIDLSRMWSDWNPKDFTPIKDDTLEKIEKALEELREEVRELKGK